MKWLMDDLGDLAGLDMVMLREAGFDREAEPLRGPRRARVGWIDAVVKRLASLVLTPAAQATREGGLARSVIYADRQRP